MVLVVRLGKSQARNYVDFEIDDYGGLGTPLPRRTLSKCTSMDAGVDLLIHSRSFRI